MLKELSLHKIVKITCQRKVGSGYDCLEFVITNKEGEEFEFSCFGDSLSVIKLQPELN